MLREEVITLRHEPQVDLQTGAIVGCEVAARLKGGEPLEAIPGGHTVAQDDGRAIPLSEWTLRRACLQVGRWHDEGARPLRLSVKVSIKELHHDRYADAVRSALQESGLEARFLEIEVQQAAAVDNFEGVAGALRKLKRLDVQLSLGSFGLGRCSLPVLKQLGCTRLKIRPRFVAANDGSDRMPFACAIVELALALDLGVIAEGVESKRAAGILANIGCHEAQGPYFGAPISSGAFAARLRARFLQQPALSYGPVTAEIKNSRKVT